MDTPNTPGSPSSPQNPVKHLRSSAQDLRDLFEFGITVRHVAEKLRTCQADDDGIVVRKQMEEFNFDVFGIEENGVIYGYVEQSGLETGPCRNYQNIFHPSELIAESTPLIDLLTILRDTPRAFVLDRNRISSIVTRGDLQKAPVRMLLFGLVTLLEMHLLRLIRICYPQESWKDPLKKSRLEYARKLLVERQARNEAIDLVDCLQFSDKRELILRNPDLRESLGFTSKNSGENLLKSAEMLRDKLAHAQDIVSGSSWPEVIDLAKEIEVLLERCEQIENREQRDKKTTA